MTVFLLDTTTLTLLQHKHPVVRANFVAHHGNAVVITSVNIEEALGGWYTALRQARTNADQARAASLLSDAFMFLSQFPVIALTADSLDRADQLVKLKLNVGRMDLKIAALALELGATVVTNNARDFARVPGLAWVDWSV
jgi:tRNA(fMet)-specific endonuclease VapC